MFFVKPPQKLEEMMAAVAHLLGEKETNWQAVRKLGKERLSAKIKGLDFSKLTSKHFALLDIFLSATTLEQISMISLEGSGLYKWVVEAKRHFVLRQHPLFTQPKPIAV